MLTDDYVAGLFDGEGFFNIDKSRPKNTRRGAAFQVHARITMRDADVLKQLQKKFGGSFRQVSLATETHASYFSWDVCGEQAYQFAERIGPLLQIKRRQSELTIEFQKFKRLNKNKPCSNERFEKLVSLYESMKQLNRKGPRTFE